MSFHTWLSFFALCWGMSLSPGPAQVASLSGAMCWGWKKCVWQTIGLASGVFVLIMIVGLGIGAMLAAAPALFFICRTLGCAYLIWLGIDLLRAKGQGLVLGKMEEKSVSAFSLWRRGFLVNLTNPKGLIFFLSLLTPFLDTESSILLQYAEMGLTCGFTDLCVMTGVTLAAEFVARKIRSPRVMRLLNIAFGCCFVAIGGVLLIVNA